MAIYWIYWALATGQTCASTPTWHHWVGILWRWSLVTSRFNWVILSPPPCSLIIGVILTYMPLDRQMIVSPKHCQFKFRSILPKKNFVSPGTMWTKIFRRVDISIGLSPREEKCAATKLVLTMMAVMGPRSVFFLSSNHCGYGPLWVLCFMSACFVL